MGGIDTRLSGVRRRRAIGGLLIGSLIFSAVVTSARDAEAEYGGEPTLAQDLSVDLTEESMALPTGGTTTAGSSFESLVPARLLESRPGEKTIDGLFEGLGRRPAGSVTELQVADRGGVAAGAAAVVLNVTAVAPSAAGFLTVFPCGSERPLASNVNYVPGDVVPNAVIAKVGTAGKVCVFASAEADLVIDVNGWFPAAVTVSTDYEIPENTKIINPEALLSPPAQESDGSTSIQLDSAAPALSVGQFVAVDPGEGNPTGTLGQVLSVTTTAAGAQNLILGPARIDEVFPSGAISFSGPIGEVADLAAAGETPRGFAVLAAALLGFNCQPGSVFDASLNLGASASADFEARWGNGPTYVRLVLDFSLKYEAAGSGRLSGSCTKDWPSKVRWPLPGTPIWISVGSMFEVAGKIDLVSVKRSGTLSYRIGFEYQDGEVTQIADVKSESSPWEVSDVTSPAAEMTLFSGAKVEVSAWDVLGVGLTFGPHAAVKFDLAGEDARYRCSLSVGLKAGVTAEVGPNWFRLFSFELAAKVFAQVQLGAFVCGTVPPPRIRTEALSNAVLGKPYFAQLDGVDGVAPLRWSLVGPANLRIEGSTIVGTPTTPGSFTVTVEATDLAGRSASRSFAMQVAPLTAEQEAMLGKVVKVGSTSYYIDLRGGKHSIPDGGTFECIAAQGKQVVEALDVSVFTPYEPAACVRADIGDIVRLHSDSYYLDQGFARRRIVDGGSFMCLDVNGADVVDVPAYWLHDLALGPDYSWSCWNASSARGKSVRASDGTSYYVDLRGGRHWMPDGGTFDCLVAQGKSDYGNIVPKEWLDDLPEFERAACVRADRGNIIRHSDGDAYLVNNDWTRSWIRDGGSYLCLSLNGHAVINSVPRYYIDDLTKGVDVSSGCWDATAARGHSVRASDGTSWYIDNRGGRHWMPDGGTFDCLVAQGKSDWGSVVPIEWVDDSPAFENAKCVRADPGDIIAHADGDSYLINSNWTRSWIKDGGIYQCLTGAGREVVSAVPRYYIEDLTAATDLTFCPADRVLRLSDGTAWYIGNDLVKRPIANGGTYLCLTAWKGKLLVNVTQVQANLFPTGANQSCVVTEANDRVIKVGSASWYVDTGGVKHPIPNGGTYLCLTAWKGKQVLSVSQDQADAIPTGANQSCAATEAANRVIRKSDGTAYYVDAALTRHWIPNGGTYTCALSVRGIPLINNVSQGHVDALAEGDVYKCRAIVIGPGNWRYYIDQSGNRFLIPGETNQDPYLCLSRKVGVAIYSYSNWNTINQFVESTTRANCGFD